MLKGTFGSESTSVAIAPHAAESQGLELELEALPLHSATSP